MFSIAAFDPFQSDDITWMRYSRLYNDFIHSELNIDEFKLLIQRQCRKRKAKYALIFDEAHDTGMAFYSYSKAASNGGEILYLVFENTIKSISDDLLRIVANGILGMLQASNAQSFITTPDNPVIQDMIIRFRGKIINTINYYGLLKTSFERRTFDHAGENRFLKDYSLSLEFHEYIPDPLYGPFSVLMTTLMNDIVRSDSREEFQETEDGIKNKIAQFKDAKIVMLTGLLFDRSRVLVGLSFVLLHPDSIVAKQEMTGVLKEYRGKKIATSLKDSITKETFRRFPRIEQVETNCYSANLPIIRINQWLGYSLERSVSQFEVGRNDLMTL